MDCLSFQCAKFKAAAKKKMRERGERIHVCVCVCLLKDIEQIKLKDETTL